MLPCLAFGVVLFCPSVDFAHAFFERRLEAVEQVDVPQSDDGMSSSVGFATDDVCLCFFLSLLQLCPQVFRQEGTIARHGEQPFCFFCFAPAHGCEDSCEGSQVFLFLLLFVVGKNFELECLCDLAEGCGVGVGVDGASKEGIVLHSFERSFEEGFSFDTEQCFVDDLRVLRFCVCALCEALHARGFSAGEDDEGCRGLLHVFLYAFHKGD